MPRIDVRHRLLPPLALAALWLASHRYFGIQHDGLYYAVQALARIDPPAFHNDLFFAFGSQDDFSLFGAAYAFFVAWLGPDTAARWMLAAGHLAWAVAAWTMARQWLGGRALWIALALAFAMPGHYGPQLDVANDILRHAEGFLTARSWAEPLVLASVAATLAGRGGLGILATLAALLCHPLMGASGALFLLAFHVRPTPGRVAVVAALSVAATLSIPSMDQPWLTEVRLRARYLLLEHWSWRELLAPLTWIGILLALADAREPLRRGANALALAAIAGLGLTALGSATHASLLVQGQPWRVLWLLQVGGVIALVTLIQARWPRSAADRWLLAGFALAALNADTVGGPLSLLLLFVSRRAWRDGPPQFPAWLPWAAGTASAPLVGQHLFLLLMQLAALAPRLAPGSQLPAGDLAAVFQGPAWLLLPATMALLLALAARFPLTSLALALAATITAGAGWDRSGDPLQRWLFNATPKRPFGSAIGPRETVYWEGNATHAWFLLRQANYASKLQAVSSVFSRPAAMESRRRLDRLAAFGATDADSMSGRSRQLPNAGGLRMLCADPVLDAVIVANPVADAKAREWVDPLRGAPWYLYRCDELDNAGKIGG